MLVFDGSNFVMKEEIEKIRKETRNKLKQQANQMIQEQKQEVTDKILQSTDITPEMVYCLKNSLYKIYDKEIQLKKLEILVSPYEADSQMAYLCISKYVDVIITEDSDLLVFGTPKVFFKMDQELNGYLIQKQNILNTSELKMQHWNFDQFIMMCILAGCDYLLSLPGYGIKKSYNLINDSKNIRESILGLVKQANEHFLLKFQKAFLTFKYSRVFCPVKQEMVLMNQLPLLKKDSNFSFELQSLDTCLQIDHKLSFLGQHIGDKNILLKLVRCELEPDSFKPFKGIYKSFYVHEKVSESLKSTNQDKQIDQQMNELNEKLKKFSLNSSFNFENDLTTKFPNKFKNSNVNTFEYQDPLKNKI